MPISSGHTWTPGWPGRSSITEVMVTGTVEGLVTTTRKVTGTPPTAAVSESVKEPSASASFVFSTTTAGSAGSGSTLTVDWSESPAEHVWNELSMQGA